MKEFLQKDKRCESFLAITDYYAFKIIMDCDKIEEEPGDLDEEDE